MPYSLPPLPYDYDALEPVLGADAMRLHHDKHHRAYVDKLNKALDAHPDLSARPIEVLLRDLNSVPEAVRKDVRNQGGGHANHSLYWETLTPGGADLSGALKSAIDEAFGDVEAFKTKFQKTGEALFGSGWTWLVCDGAGRLEILGLANQDSPLSLGKTPLLLCDLWEHAYYPDYQNRRPDWLVAWWDIVDWSMAGQRYDEARRSPSADASDSARTGELFG